MFPFAKTLLVFGVIAGMVVGFASGTAGGWVPAASLLHDHSAFHHHDGGCDDENDCGPAHGDHGDCGDHHEHPRGHSHGCCCAVGGSIFAEMSQAAPWHLPGSVRTGIIPDRSSAPEPPVLALDKPPLI